ncbi:hydrocephalus-inducing protein homolog isoform X2 [Hippocampus zosterae]|uniref:hydrocephalus-inducing protein homolog isoform X2 n=1 Tax=Hippocampus zosterae TaxID=109293 RepID=UPI00223DEDA3|nr:hydrocephalus-inducing protein homolog isoform X2 [Hippocampus zosterae]
MLQSRKTRLTSVVNEMHPPRFLDLLDPSTTVHQNMPLVDVDESLFQPHPAELVFQNFTPAQSYKLPLQLFNNDKISRHVKLEHQESAYFHVEGPKEAKTKVAAGLSVGFTVCFTPQENKDYHHTLFFVTEREHFEVPIRAIGPRANLNFRDELHLPVCLVKASTQRTQLVRNLGDRIAIFKLQTQSPFSVTPFSGTLDIGESMQITVAFNPMTAGDHRQDLLLHYDTGEDVHISLHGSCVELKLNLIPEHLTLEKTYISLSNTHTVSLSNSSDTTLKYCWTTWSSQSEEIQDCAGLELQQNVASHLLVPCQSDPTADHRPGLLALSRGCITVEPALGEIWPNTTARFTVVFKPDEAKLYQETIYCDVTGKKSCIPLIVKGEGLGPAMHINCNLMEMKNIFIGHTVSYEVQLSNNGLIDAPFEFSSPRTTFGQFFSFTPKKGIVCSGAGHVVKITFHSNILGTFSEGLLLSVTGQPQPLILTFRGCVIGPTFHFSVSELNFGDVAYGFPQTKMCSLINTSFVPMSFSLRVVGDGIGSPSVTSDQQVCELCRNNWQGSTAHDGSTMPVEFTVSPALGSVRAMADVSIKVSLCSNTVKDYRMALVIDVEGVGKKIMALPIIARCIVPEIMVETPLVDFQKCFLNHPYEKKVHLTNQSALPVCYGMLEQEYEESPSVIFGSTSSRGVIPPHSSADLPVFLLVKNVGKHHHTLYIALFGSIHPPLEVVLSCTGRGPIVLLQCQNQHLEFGKIPVLTDVTKTIPLSNQSPIPACFTARMSQGKSPWHVEPSEGEVPPQGQLELKVVANLKDTLLFHDKLEISIQGSQTLTVALSATGTGTTIVSDKPLFPNLDLGTHFSHGSCDYYFKVTNYGQRVHRLYWKIECSSGRTFLPSISAVKKRDSVTTGWWSSPTEDRPVFSISPTRIELFPGGSVDMTLKGSSDYPKVVRETLVCCGIVGHQGIKEHIFSVEVTCQFVTPILSMSSQKLNFYIEKLPGVDLTQLYEELVLKNVSSLSLSMELSLATPFSLCEARGVLSTANIKNIALVQGEETHLWICFDPTCFHGQLSQVVDQTLNICYKGHPQQDKVEMHAEVHYPNLHFSSTTVDFGSVLNSTENHQEVTMTNCSPLPVFYHWACLVDHTHCVVRSSDPSVPALSDEGIIPDPDVSQCSVCVQEIFDVLPMHGHLKPGEQQLVTFIFHAQDFVTREVVAQCQVEHGPIYNIELRGEASEISFILDSTTVDFGLQRFDQIGESTLILRNTGKVGFKFATEKPQKKKTTVEQEKQDTTLEIEDEQNEEIRPGQPKVIPAKGYIDAGSKYCLRVLYLPGIPEKFEKQFQLDVAHLPPQIITLTGEGVFPKISLNLPRSLAKESHSDVLDQARKTVKMEGTSALDYEQLLLLEIEKLLVTENALAVSKRLLEVGNSQGSTKKWNKLSKFLLPEYVLDFGYVVPSQVLKQTVKITNNGPLPVSFHANSKVTAGFKVEFGSVRNLSCGEKETFTVEFDSQKGSLSLGIRSAIIPIQVIGGPSVQVRLCAVVTVPSISVSSDTLQFDIVRCGLCKIQTMQLFNHESVPCQWSIVEDVKPVKVDKFLPLHQLSKYLQQHPPPPVMFEMTPSSGILTPGERVNVQVKFSPTEGCLYKRHLIITVNEGTQPVIITALGQGEDPELVFCPPDLTMGPCLPFSMEIEAEVIVKNPCSYPIEFYSLEFDTQYLKEEKILNLLDGYDANDVLLLPPRYAGESLPVELMDFYKDHCSRLKDKNVTGMSLQKRRGGKRGERRRTELIISDIMKAEATGSLGTLEINPLSSAIARYMGVDLSPNGLAALNCRGIAIIIYGAPLTDQSSIATALANHYGGACLSMDAMLADSLMHGTSLVSLAGRQLFNRAAEEHAQRMEEAAHISANIGSKPDSPVENIDPNSVPTETPSKHAESCSSDMKVPNEKGSTSSSQAIDKATLSNLLPEQILVEILTERFQFDDCYCGIIIHGLDSVYTTSVTYSLQVVLKALKNRKHIYVMNLVDTYSALKARKKAQKKAEDAMLKEKALLEEEWLQNMDEEEYEALPEEEKERIIEQQKQKKLKVLERIRKMQKDKKQQDEMKKLRLDELKKKSKKGAVKEGKQASRKKGSVESKQPSSAMAAPRMPSSKESLVDKKDQSSNDGKEEKSKEDTIGDTQSDPASEMPTVDKLHGMFNAYEKCQTQVEHILHHWDREKGLLRVPLPGQEPPQSQEDHPAEKQAPAARKSKKSTSKIPSPSNQMEPAKSEKAAEKPAIIPHIVLKLAGKDYPDVLELLRRKYLPPLHEVLDELGLGTGTLSIPPPIIFSVVHLPKNRERNKRQLNSNCFTFLSRSAGDDRDERKEEDDEDVQSIKTPKGRRASAKLMKEKDKKGRESQKSVKRPAALPKAKGLEQTLTSALASSTTDLAEQDPHHASVEQKRNQSLTAFRWVVPANGQVVLKIWFYSGSPGKFEQTFNFELLGTHKVYQLLCKGICTFPSFCKDYKVLFPYCRDVPKFTQGIKRTYVVNPGFYEFGPLLCSKTRDRYKDNRYPENTERMVIKNNSGLEAEIQFHFQNDTQAITYMLDPPSMTLQPDQEQELTVWAYPTTPGEIKDNIVCCIKDNPELFTIALSCLGVRPELELESKRMHFNRVLLHRQESRSVKLHNRTPLPISWRLHGLEELGDEFSVSQDHSVVLPNTSLLLTMHFLAKKPLNIKKQLRLEVSDAENILGVLYTDKIQVSAEGFDIAMDITPDGCLDFGTIKVFEEVERTIKLKNQGKYEFVYKILVGDKNPNLISAFTMSPATGTLIPRKKYTSIQIVCKPKKEVSVTDKPVLSCQVIEPSIGDGGHIVAILPINVTVQSVFSRYTISPSCDINFGPLVYGSKKSQTFILENSGIFETHYTISCVGIGICPRARQGGKKATRESTSEKSHTPGTKMKSESFQKDSNVSQNRLSTGVFAVFPCTGTMQPRTRQAVTVECIAEQLGSWSQNLLIDISGRDPSDHPEGIPYKLIAEICRPGIVLDMASIFEEHHICQSISQLTSEPFFSAEQVFILDDNKLIFNKILVGRTSQARLKLTNNSKVPYTLNLGIRYVGIKMSGNVDVFELSSPTLWVPGQSQAFTSLSFTPHTMHLYNAVFEATFDKSSRITTNLKSKVLEFDIIGEGCLPVVSVIRPASKSNPVLRFRRTLVGRTNTLPLVLLNDGNVPAQVQIDMTDKHNVLTLRAVPENKCGTINFSQFEDTLDSARRLVHRACLKLDVNEEVEFEVTFSSTKPLRVEDKISVQVKGSLYSNATIQVTGEAYQQLVSLDNLRKPPREMNPNYEEEDYSDLLSFGHCHVASPVRETFTLMNHSSSNKVVRFEWPSEDSYLTFSPQVGHLHAGCSKEMTVIFCAKGRVTLTKQQITCKICQVTFQLPLDQVPDWDDQKKTVQGSWTQPQQTGKNKKQNSEPGCSVVKGSDWDLHLRVSAVCDFVKFSCNTTNIRYKDTLAYQSSTHQVQIVNEGAVRLEFSWQVLIDSSSCPMSQEGGMSSRTVTEERPPSTLTTERSLLMGSPHMHYFTVEPSIGAILPGTVQIFSVCFSPLEAGQFQGRLHCSIPNLRAGAQGPTISFCGRSILPHCHFDLEDSDYISGSRRNPEFRTYLEPNIRVIECKTLGLFTPAKRSFTVLNPTNVAYSFHWKCEDTGNSPFSCLTPYGCILPGGKSEMCFKYVAEQVNDVESFWSFVIETLSLSMPFLCVGSMREPLVYFEIPHIDFGEQLIGNKVSETVNIVNREKEPFHFTVLQPSLLCDDQESNLILQPMSGTVPANDRFPLSVSFSPCRQGYVSFRITLRVKRKSQFLILTCKAHCFKMTASVQVENPDGGLRELSPDILDTLDFGKVGISEQATFNILVTNTGRQNMDVNFELEGPSELLQYLLTKPKKSTIAIGQKLQSAIFFSPRSSCTLTDIRLIIRVNKGPLFTIAIEGRGVSPELEFSFTKYNFGKNFVYCPGMVPASHTLVLKNKGNRDISVKCQSKKCSFLEIGFKPDVLCPGAVVEVPITFYPREPRRYHESVIFLINSCIKEQVDIWGQGIELKLGVLAPKHQKVKLGNLTPGQKVVKRVQLVNRSILDISFTLQLDTKKPRLDTKDLSISPEAELYLKCLQGSCNVEILFTPHQRISPFTAELNAEIDSYLHPLLSIQGCCQGVEVRLEQDHLGFGAVVQHCQGKKKVVIINTGELCARFQWKTEDFPPELSVHPSKGSIQPGTEVPLEFTFAPVRLNNDSRYENLTCCIEGTASPITLTVTGSCITAASNKEVINFSCPVRGSHTQTLSVVNPTNQCCSIRPVINGKHWRAAPSVVLEPLQSNSYVVTYRPLTMTVDGKKHLGSVFFSFPNGAGMLYSLQGTTEAPKAESTIVHELPAKTHHTQILPVTNWLSKQKRFLVIIEFLSPENPDTTVSLKGREYIDVPALSKKDYKIHFYTFREGQYNAKVTFLNEASGEYLFYIINFKVTSPVDLSVVELVSNVREKTSATIEVENPLTTPICLTVDCKCPDISAPSLHTVPGMSKGALTFDYQPLRVGETTSRLSLFCSDLGYFHYGLLLRALPQPPEKTIQFSASLGSSHSVAVKFLNFSHFKTEYACKTDCPAFLVNKTVAALPGNQTGSQVSVEVCFEPYHLGEVKGQLHLSSGIGGEYVFLLHGVGLPSKTQGPFNIRNGRSISIPFKNVFLQTTVFSFQVDNPCFTVKAADTFLSKKTQPIQVYFVAPEGGSPGPCIGKLTITNQATEAQSICSWIYYLRGNLLESS